VSAASPCCALPAVNNFKAVDGSVTGHPAKGKARGVIAPSADLATPRDSRGAAGAPSGAWAVASGEGRSSAPSPCRSMFCVLKVFKRRPTEF
jgi:hypothetical protein